MQNNYNGNGFTLLELLAVIVILAIILAIAIPSITSLINSSKKNTFESNSKMIFSSLRLKALEDNNFDPTTINETNIKSILNIDDSNIKKLSISRVGEEIYIVLTGENNWKNFSVSGTFNNLLVTEGLVLYLDASNEDSYSGSGTTWNDLSGNGNNGTLTNGVLYDNGVMSFDGVDDYVAPSGSTNSKSISIFMWINPSSFNCPGLPSSNCALVMNMGEYFFEVGNSLIKVYGYKFNTPTWVSASSSEITLNTWTHVGFTYDQETLSFYVNGNKI